MTRAEAVKVLKMVEAHGLADEARRVAIDALMALDKIEEWIKECQKEIHTGEQHDLE